MNTIGKSGIDWSKAPYGATHHSRGYICPWYKLEKGIWFVYDLNDQKSWDFSNNTDEVNNAFLSKENDLKGDFIEKENPWKIKHIKSKHYVCGLDSAATILYRSIGNGYVEYKYAICNSKDMFCRKKGVEVAKAKVETFRIYSRESTLNDLFTTILLHISLGNHVSEEFYKLIDVVEF